MAAIMVWGRVCDFCTQLVGLAGFIVSRPSRQFFFTLPPFQKFLEELVLSFIIEPWWRVRLLRFRRVHRRDLGRLLWHPRTGR